MNKTKNTKPAIYTLTALFIFFTGWWIINGISASFRAKSYVLFSEVYGIIALVGGLYGLFISRSLGGFKSYFGKAIIWLSIGLLLQEFGQIAYSYMNSIQHVEVPYPSIPDIGFFGSIPTYILGAYYLAKGLGVGTIIKKSPLKLIASIVVAVVIVVGTYWMFLKGYDIKGKSNAVIFFDFAYPLLQAVFVVIAMVTFLSVGRLLGGTMKKPVLLLLLAFLIQFVADANYLYQIIKETWGPAGYGDYIYMLAYFVMSLSIIYLCLPVIALRTPKQNAADAVEAKS